MFAQRLIGAAELDVRSFKMHLKKSLTIVCIVVVVIAIGAAGIGYALYNADRADFSKSDDAITVEKNLGFIPSSKEVYIYSTGFMDPTVFYKAKVTSNEVRWLNDIPEVSPFSPPRNSPLWWRTSETGKRFYRTSAKWPCLYVYDEKGGWLYGTKEYE